ARMLLHRHEGSTRLDHLLGSVQELRGVDSHDGRRHHAEIGERRISSTNAGYAVKDVPEMITLGHLLEFRPRIGNRDESAAYFFLSHRCFHPLPKILLEDIRFECAA